jgi:hypothetical protein
MADTEMNMAGLVAASASALADNLSERDKNLLVRYAVQNILGYQAVAGEKRLQPREANTIQIIVKRAVEGLIREYVDGYLRGRADVTDWIDQIVATATDRILADKRKEVMADTAYMLVDELVRRYRAAEDSR